MARRALRLSALLIGVCACLTAAAAAKSGHGHHHHGHRGPRGPQGEQGPAGPAGPTAAAPTLHLHYVSGSTATLQPNSAGGTFAECPAGTSLTSGGVFGSGGVNQNQILASYPAGGGDGDSLPDDIWTALAYNLSASTQTVKAYGVCVEGATASFQTPPSNGRPLHRGRHHGHRGPRGPRGAQGPQGAQGAAGTPTPLALTYFRENQVSLATTGVQTLTADCPGGSKVTGAGLNTPAGGPPQDSRINAMFPSDTNGSVDDDQARMEVNKLTAGPYSVTAYAICLSAPTTSQIDLSTLMRRGHGGHGHHRGPRGPRGPQGSAGPAGGSTPIPLIYVVGHTDFLAALDQDLVTADCPEGSSVVGGGYFTSGLEEAMNGSLPQDSTADADTIPDDGWGAYVDNGALAGTAHVNAVAICAPGATAQAG